MRWISKDKSPPVYVWKGDDWFNESNKKIYVANIDNHVWENESGNIPFAK